METKADTTQRAIIQCAQQEFMAVGFHRASLRKIAAAAQVTTGAIYRYFPDKNALFAAATENVYALLKAMFNDMTSMAIAQVAAGNEYGKDVSQKNLSEMYNLIYDHFDEFFILLTCSDEAYASSFIHEFVQMEEQSTLAYIEALKLYYRSSYEVDKVALHFLIEAYVSALLEPIRHRMGREDAILHARSLVLYFSVGWLGLEGLMRAEVQQ